MFITDMSQNKWELNEYEVPVIYKYELEEIRKIYHMYENSGVPVSELHITFNHLRFNFEYIDCFTDVKNMYGYYYDTGYEGPVMYIDTMTMDKQWPGETRDHYENREDFTYPVIIDKGKFWYTEYWAYVNDDEDPWTEEDEANWTTMKSWDSFDEWIDYIEKALIDNHVLKNEKCNEMYFPYKGESK